MARKGQRLRAAARSFATALQKKPRRERVAIDLTKLSGDEVDFSLAELPPPPPTELRVKYRSP